MINRFHIEDIIAQDTEGITYRALDTQADAMVALRRFFPFDTNDVGLRNQEQASYNVAISKFTRLNHPALRAVVGGGCDPIDGIPYIVTEWVEGDTLQSIIERGPLPAEVAAVLLTQALEVCEFLSKALEEEAIWVETDLQTIVLGNEATGRGFTFWNSPAKWLGVDGQSCGFGTLATLAEEIMDWKNKTIRDDAGGGLGKWIKWLRGAPPTTPLREVREMLTTTVTTELPINIQSLMIKASPQPVSPPVKVRQPTKSKPAEPAKIEPSIKVKKSSSPKKWMIPALLLLMVAGLAAFGWYVYRGKHNKTNGDTAENVRGSMQDLSGLGRSDSQTYEIIPWESHTHLTQSTGKTIILEGVAKGVESSHTGKTVYLLFADASEKSIVRAGIEANQETPASIKKTFESFVGKKIHFTGSVAMRVTPGSSRPEVMAKNLSAIKAAK